MRMHTMKQTLNELRSRVDNIKLRLTEMREIIANDQIAEDDKESVRDSIRFWSRSLAAAEAELKRIE